MKYLLPVSALASLFSLPLAAADLTYGDLVSAEHHYLVTGPGQEDQQESIIVPVAATNEPLDLAYTDQYERALFSLGELDVERKITLNGGGKALRADAFELGFHIAVNYTP